MRYLHVRKLVGYGGREIRGKFALSLIISLFLSLLHMNPLMPLFAFCLPITKPQACPVQIRSLSVAQIIAYRWGCENTRISEETQWGVAWVCMLRLLWFIQLCVKKGLGSVGFVYIKFFFWEEDETWPLGLSLGCLVKAVPESALLTWLRTFNH